MQSTYESVKSTHEQLAMELEGSTCFITRGCSGILEESSYKGNDALVCASCGTPATQVWNE